MTSSYPIVLTGLEQARVVVIGGGQVAERKLSGLLEAGARPTVISPAITPAIASWRDEGRLAHLPRRYRADDLAGAAIAIAATDDPAVNRAIAADARRHGALANIADDPEAGDFHTVATVRRGDLLLTVSTGGGSPGLAARVRAELAARYGPEYARALELAAALRALPAEELRADERAALTAWLCAEPALGWLRDGDDDLVAEAIQRALAARAGVAA